MGAYVCSWLAEKRAAYAAASKSARKANASDWTVFADWCRAQQVEALPASPGTMVAFLIDTAGKVAVMTQCRRLSAVQDKHRPGGFNLDLNSAGFREVCSGIRRSHRRPPVDRRLRIEETLKIEGIGPRGASRTTLAMPAV